MSKAPLAAGATLDSITIVDVLASDDFGFSYRARDEQTRSTVIVQEFFPALRCDRADDGTTVVAAGDMTGDSFETGLHGFLQQARSLAQLNDPNIRIVSHYAEANGTAYLLMPDEPGETLASILARHQNRGVSEELVQSVLSGLLNALVTLDNAGIVHGDIAPETVFVRRNGPCMLTDFGMARHDFFESCGLLSRSLREGYAPVELCGDRHAQGVWTDLYSLGATLYRCVTGSDPVDAMTRARALREGKVDPLVPVRESGASRFSDELLSDIDALLAFAPEDRPPSAANLQRLRGAASVQHSPDTSAPVASVDPVDSADMTPVPRSVAAQLWRWAFPLAAVVAGVLGYVVLRDQGGVESEPVDQSAQTASSVIVPEQSQSQTAATTPPTPARDAQDAQSESDAAALISKQDDLKRIDAYRDQMVKDQEAERERAIKERISARVRERLSEERASQRVQEAAAAEQKAAQVAAFVAKGNQALDAGNIAAPPASNAMHFFREALYLDRNDPGARGGMDRVFDVIADRVQNALGSGQVDDAANWLSVFSLQRPEDERIPAWQERIRVARASDATLLRQNAVDELKSATDEAAAERERTTAETISLINEALDAGELERATAGLTTLRSTDADSPALQMIERAIRREARISELMQADASAENEVRERDQQRIRELEQTVDELRGSIADSTAREAQADATAAANDEEASLRDLLSKATAEIIALRAERDQRVEQLNNQLAAAQLERRQAVNRAVEAEAERDQALQTAVSAATVTPAETSEVVQAAAQPTPALRRPTATLQNAIATYYAGDYTKSFEGLLPLAISGEPRAQFRVSVMYFHGRGVGRNQAEAERWLVEAFDQVRTRAEAGEAWAQADFGAMYERGWRVSQSYDIAAQWYERAVEKGYAPAQNNLAVLHAQGLGVSQSRERALSLLRLAAAQGDAIAKENLDILSQ